MNDFHTLAIGFILAVTTFYINHRLKKAIDIKILINSLFDIFARKESLQENDPFFVVNILSSEIISLAKIYDKNPHIEKEMRKLKMLKNIWFDFSREKITEKEFIERVNELRFKKLGTSFILLVFFNPDS